VLENYSKYVNIMTWAISAVRFSKPASGKPSTSNNEFHGGFPDSWPWSHIITPNSDGSTELASESLPPASQLPVGAHRVEDGQRRSGKKGGGTACVSFERGIEKCRVTGKETK